MRTLVLIIAIFLYVKNEDHKFENMDNESFLFRTYYENESSWQLLKKSIEAENDNGFKAYLNIIDDKRLAKLSAQEILASQSQSWIDKSDYFFFVVDSISVEHPEHPVLCFKIPNEYSPENDEFRVIPSEMWAVENNLRIANMDFEDFSRATGKDGIFRGH